MNFMPALSDYLGRSEALTSFGDDVKQRVRERLFVPREGVLPRIASYTGRGPLAGWLRILATRTAIDARRAQQRAAGHASDDGLCRVAAASPDPELGYLKGRYAREFGEATANAPYLRTGLNKHTMQDLAGNLEPHALSEVLTGTIFSSAEA